MPREPGAVAAIDWTRWRPGQRAALLFVIREGRILLIHKKLGLGAGKINGPGGRIEAGETPADAAVREVKEELCVVPFGVQRCGELFFQFRDGLAMHATVFRATGCAGEPAETGEAIPAWAPVDRIPYEAMWEDDRLWIPLMLAGTPFRGYFVFDGDRMLDHRIERLATDGAEEKPPSDGRPA